MLRQSTKERKAKLRVAIKEFNHKLLNLVTIQDKMEKNISHYWATSNRNRGTICWNMEVNEPIKNFEILLAKDNVDEKK